MKLLPLKAGNHYTNIAGALVKLVASSANGAVFTDSEGNQYDPFGKSLAPEFRLGLSDPALKVAVGETYEFHWEDGRSVGRYAVTATDDRGYDIIWSNSATMRINYGCPLNYESKRIAYGQGTGEPEIHHFENGWSARREYGLVRLPGSEDPIIVGGVFGMGKWVLRDAEGNAVDMDIYQSDLFDRHKVYNSNRERPSS